MVEMIWGLVSGMIRLVLRCCPAALRQMILQESSAAASEDRLLVALRGGLLARSEDASARDFMKLLLRMDNMLYELQGRFALSMGEGVHVKHDIMKYHDFFINRLQPGDRVLDIGCGQGELARDMAERAKAVVVGIDHNESSIKTARERLSHENVEYRVGDAFDDFGDSGFNVVVLSNVLEHIDQRQEFLRQIAERVRPERILIRVPSLERDWRVPLKKELDVEWRLDSDHSTEYTREEFFAECESAGLKVMHHECRWGEIWAEVRAQ